MDLMMGKVLYSAVDTYGNDIYGYAKGKNNKEVISLLKINNLTDIKLYADAHISSEVEDLASIGKDKEVEIAKHEIDMFMHPTFKKHFLFAMKDNKKLAILFFGLILLILGIYNSYNYIGFFGFTLILGISILQWVTYSFTSNYRKLYRAFAYGKWLEVKNRIDHYKNYDEKVFPANVKVEFDKMEAILLAIHNNPTEALDIVIEKYGFLEKISPYAYDNLFLSVHKINGDYGAYLKQMKKIYESNPEIATHVVDMAMAEAFFGDKNHAMNILKELNTEELPIYVIPMVDTIKGVVLKDINNTESLAYFKKAALGMQKFKTNSFYLIVVAITIGYYAITAFDDGQDEHAISLLENVWDILRIHGHKSLLEDISIRMPQYK